MPRGNWLVKLKVGGEETQSPPGEKKMKNKLSQISRAALVAAVIATVVNSQGGLLKILKGEPEAAVASEEFQKVAFVGEATVKEIKGIVEVMSGTNKWSELGVASQLKPGAVIRTGKESSVVLKMTGSGSFVKVTPQTVLRLVAAEEGWGRAAVTGEGESGKYQVRALRGLAQYEQNGKWLFLSTGKAIEPGTRVRLGQGTVADFYSRKHGVWRAAGFSEVILPATEMTGTRILTRVTPALAAAK